MIPKQRDKEYIQAVKRRFGRLKDQRQDHERRWKDIRDYIAPGLARFPQDGEKKNEKVDRTKIYDGTAGLMSQVLIAGIHSGLTSPSRPWLDLMIRQDEIADHQDVRTWLDQATEVNLTALALSNAYGAFQFFDASLVHFGVAAMWIEERPDKMGVPWFRPMPVGTYYLGLGDDGRIDKFFREVKMTPERMRARYGDKLPQQVEQDLKNKQWDKEYSVLQVVQKRPPRDVKRRALGPQSRPYEGLEIFLHSGSPHGSDHVLLDVGFHEFPIIASRWDVRDPEHDAYGYGPSDTALPDVKMLQKLTRDQLKAVAKIVDPPMINPAGQNKRLNHLPGGETWMDAQHAEGVRPLYQVGLDVSAVSSKIVEVQQQLRRIYFADLFLSADDHPNMTATEVIERRQEKLTQLGPAVERQHNEMLTPMVDRIWGVLLRAGAIPGPPQILQQFAMERGIEVEPQFISPLVQAQRLSDANSIQALLALVGQAMAINPEAGDTLDTDELVQEYSKITGTPATLIRSDQVLAAMRKARAEAAQRQQEQEMALQTMREGSGAIQKIGQLAQSTGDPESSLGQVQRSLGA